MRFDLRNISQEILDRYNVAGPRYTSYPTAPEWADSFGVLDYEQALKELNKHVLRGRSRSTCTFPFATVCAFSAAATWSSIKTTMC